MSNKKVNIKNDFHQLIDQIEDEKILQEVYEILKNYQKKQGEDFWDSMTEEQRQELNKALLESEKEENLISHEEVMKQANKWKKT